MLLAVVPVNSVMLELSTQVPVNPLTSMSKEVVVALLLVNVPLPLKTLA